MTQQLMVTNPEFLAPILDDSQLSGTLRLRMWFENSSGVLFGLGRLMLLQQVAEAGSLKGAAEKLGMSYRAAWGKIKTTEKIMGMKLIEKSSCNRAGYRLSPSGEAFCRQYSDFFKDVEQFALHRAETLPLLELHGFEEDK